MWGWGPELNLHLLRFSPLHFPGPSLCGAEFISKTHFWTLKRKKTHCSLMLKAKVTMTQEGQGHHDTTRMLSDWSRIPTEQFLKGMSARVISKLLGTRALQSSGGNKALSDPVPVIDCFVHV